MTTLDIAIELGLSPKKVGPKEHASPCPFCGGNDRFRIWPEKGDYGAYWCRQCQEKGDAIKLLMEAPTLRLSYKEACARLGKVLTGGGRRRGGTPRAPSQKKAEFVPRETAAPADLWQAKAAAFVEASHQVLLKTPDQLAWLAERGITVETARRFRLGWNAQDIWRARPAWGVEDNGKKIWLPVGLVIPYAAGGSILRVRVRRPEGEPHYYIVPSTPPCSAPMMIPPEFDRPRGAGGWCVVESELDALLVAQEAGDLVGVAALGSVANKPDTALHAALKDAGHIMNALDFDGPAAKAWTWWREHFPQAERWPVPRGKDPGDYRKEGGDIRAWVIAGLPPGLRPGPSKQVEKEENQTKHLEKERAFDSTPRKEEAESNYFIPKAAKHEGQFDKKAGLTISDEDEGLTPYIVDDGACKGCGDPLTIYWPRRGQRPPDRCFNCLPQNPWKGVAV